MPKIRIPHYRSHFNWVLSGGLAGLASPAFGCWPLLWLAFLWPFWTMLHRPPLKTLFWGGVLYGVTYHAFVFAWFWGLHPLDWAGLSASVSWLVTLLGWLFLVGSQGLIVGLVFSACGQLNRYVPHPAIGIMLFPLLWWLGLWGLNAHDLGQPWGSLSTGQTPLAIAAPWLVIHGPYALPLFDGLVLWVQGLFVWTLWSRQLRPFITISLLLTGLKATAPTRMPPVDHATEALLSQLHPVLIQGNLSLKAEKTQGAAYRQAVYLALLKHVSPQHRLVILPEGLFTDPQPLISQRKPQQTLISGGIQVTPEHVWNGIYFVTPHQAPLFYPKAHRVVFGEFLPYLPQATWQTVLSKIGLAYRGFDPAPSPPLPYPVLKVSETQTLTIIPLVCYDALYPAQNATRPAVIVNVSNLGWYHNQPGLAKTMLALHQWQAIGLRHPVLFATNTGISAMLDASGRVRRQSLAGQQSFLSW